MHRLGGGVAQRVVAAGLRCIVSNQDKWYLDHLDTTWEQFYTNEPLTNITKSEQQKLVIGGEVCMWGETVDASDIQQTIWPRAAAAAGTCLLWSMIINIHWLKSIVLAIAVFYFFKQVLEKLLSGWSWNCCIDIVFFYHLLTKFFSCLFYFSPRAVMDPIWQAGKGGKASYRKAGTFQVFAESKRNCGCSISCRHSINSTRPLCSPRAWFLLFAMIAESYLQILMHKKETDPKPLPSFMAFTDETVNLGRKTNIKTNLVLRNLK